MSEVFKYITWMLSPLGVWVVFTALSWVRRCGSVRFRLALRIFAGLQLLVFSLPWVAGALLGGLEQQGRQLALQQGLGKEAQHEVDAIVVLGGGMDGRFQGHRDLPDLNDSADRVWAAARLFQQIKAPYVVVSGGSFTPQPEKQIEALAMEEMLQDFGVPPGRILVEEHSRTTLENAMLTSRALSSAFAKTNPDKPWRVALVTSAFHLKRATALFEQAGFQVRPVLADVRIVPEQKASWEYLPKPEALERSTMAIKEHLGLLQVRWARWFVRD